LEVEGFVGEKRAENRSATHRKEKNKKVTAGFGRKFILDPYKLYFLWNPIKR
jgi:hypothetical protein